MRQKKTKQLHDYWMDLFWKAGNLAGSSLPPVWPQRSDVHPAECRGLLGDMFILEVDEGKLTYRLAGTRLCALYGHELKGESFGSTFAVGDRDAAIHWGIKAGPENYIAVMSGTASDTANNRVVMETLLMPVACNTRHANRILGLTVACNPQVTLGNRKVDNQRIKSVRTLRPWENADSHQPFFESAYGHTTTPRGLRSIITRDDTPAMTSPISGEPRHVAHLRVYEGGKAEI